MTKKNYRKYNLTITLITILSIIITISLTVGLVYFTYKRAQKRLKKAQNNATFAAKAICSTILSVSPGSAGNIIRGALNNETGQEIIQACQNLNQ